MESEHNDSAAAPTGTPVVRMHNKEPTNGRAASAHPVPRRSYGRQARSVLLPTVLAALCVLAAYLAQVNPWREAQSNPAMAVGLPELSRPPVSFSGHDGGDELYEVTFDGEPAWVLHSRRPKRSDTQGSSNMASITMKRADDGSYVPVRVWVKDKVHSQAYGDEWHLRPSHYHDAWEFITDIDASKSRKGVISFTVNQPLQVSVELGDYNIIFKDSGNPGWRFFNSLILSFNPPYDEMPVAFPTITGGKGKNMKCESSVSGRDCVVATTDDPCAEDIRVEPRQDLYFPMAKKQHYIWEEGCGGKPKRIILSKFARIFIDDDVVVYATVIGLPKSQGVGIFGYGTFSNVFMDSQKNPMTMQGVFRLQGPDSKIWGPIVSDSTYRNIIVAANGEVYWTKSITFVSETDCIDARGAGIRIKNNFFKVHDDCLKAFFPDSIFADNVVWHADLGRAILLSWGNYGVGANMVDNQDIFYYNTSIIHDEKAHSTDWNSDTNVVKTLSKQQLMGYLIGAYHSPANMIGRPDNPILIENVFLEGHIGVAIQLSSGYHNINNKAPWMGVSESLQGCSGDVHVEIKGVDMSRTLSHRGTNVITGCEDDDEPGVINGQCLCREELNCPKGKRCKVHLKVSDVVEHKDRFLRDNILIGKNAIIKGSDDEAIFG